MILNIDTSQREPKAQEFLPSIQHINLKDIESIEIYPGPGSYTGLRVGFAIAHTLGYLLRVPVNGKKYPHMALPTY